MVIFIYFLSQISGIKRLVPRLKSMKFKLQYPDTVQDSKPVSCCLVDDYISNNSLPL